MVSAHDPGNGPGTSGPGIVEPSLIRPRQTADTATDLHRSPLVTPDTSGKPGHSAYQGIQSDISARSRLLKRCTPLQQELDRDFDVTVWNQDVFRLTYDALDSLLAALDSSDAGVFVLRPDDLTESRGQSSLTVRDNVVFELGMFIGRLGRDRSFMLTPNISAFHLPSDLIGITTAHYDPERFDRQPRAAVGPACSQIRQALRSIEPRISPEPKFRARLDRAMSRMSKDLENLLAYQNNYPDHADSFADWPGAISVTLGRTSVRLEVGRIQDYQSADTRAVNASWTPRISPMSAG